jgi:transcriptional regulator with XRE-family HTH domain
MQNHDAAHERAVRTNRRKGALSSTVQRPLLRPLSTSVPSTEHGLSANGQAARDQTRPRADEERGAREQNTESLMTKRTVETRGSAREQNKQRILNAVEARTEAGELDHERPSRPPAEVLPVVAANLTRLRVQKGLSIAELSALSHVSPTLLEALSSGKQEPNIKTLWSLANALGVPFRALIAEQSAGDAGSTPNVSSRRVLASRDGGRDSEVYEIKLGAKASESAAARRKGAVENLLVTHGSAEVRAGALHYTLHEGESVSFRADQARHYQSLGDASATLYIVISQPVD